MNKEERKIYNAEYRKKHKQKIIEYRKKYYESNKEDIKQYYIDNAEEKKAYGKQRFKDNPEYWKQYNKENKDRYNEYWRQYRKDRKKNDPEFKLTCTIRDRINSAITKGYKKCKSMDLLGCEISFAREYIESKFTPEMDWSNHGKVWELDHIKPIAAFDLTSIEEQHKCFHYTNLQPLKWQENRRKGDRYLEKQDKVRILPSK